MNYLRIWSFKLIFTNHYYFFVLVFKFCKTTLGWWKVSKNGEISQGVSKWSRNKIQQILNTQVLVVYKLCKFKIDCSKTCLNQWIFWFREKISEIEAYLNNLLMQVLAWTKSQCNLLSTFFIHHCLPPFTFLISIFFYACHNKHMQYATKNVYRKCIK